MDPINFITPGNVRAVARSRRVPFPHMGPGDTKVWRAAIDAHLVEFERYEYDVRLGGAAAIAIDDAHTQKAMWETLLRKRVDVVGWNGDQPTIVEVKPVGSFAALGQCLGYGYLWGKEKPNLKQARLMIVCARCDDDLKPCFASYGISVVELPLEIAERVLSPHGRAWSGEAI